MRIRKKDIIIKLWTYISGIITVSLIIFLFVYIFFKGYKVISWEFITDVPKGMILGTEGGIAPALIGSFLSAGIAVIISGIFSVCTGIYLTFYENNKRKTDFIHWIINCINGIPSIVLGLFGYTVFSVYLGFGRSILSGGLVLAMMIFPAAEIKIEKSFKELNRDIINASYSLGISKIYTIFKIVIPVCRKEIFSALSLVYGYAMGATAPVMFCMTVINSPVSFDIRKPSMSLSYHLYILMTQGISLEMAYGTAFVLLGLILAVFILCNFLIKKKNEE